MTSTTQIDVGVNDNRTNKPFAFKASSPISFRRRRAMFVVMLSLLLALLLVVVNLRVIDLSFKPISWDTTDLIWQQNVSYTVPAELSQHYDSNYNASQTNTGSTSRRRKQSTGRNAQGGTSAYAYAFVLGGCDPDNTTHSKYHGFLYNIIISARILQQEGSNADLVVFIQMSYTSAEEVLPDRDLRLLEIFNIQVLYIPKSEHQSFYDTVLNKFRILSLTQYRRVLLLDADCMPLGNLDYIFEFSDGPPEYAVLKENLIMTGPMEPANAGFFMLSPKAGDLEIIEEIIRRRENRGPDFDIKLGWGHEIVPPDKWKSRKNEGTNWDFHFAYSDQGLLYHWTKYVKKSVSVLGYGYQIENWGQSDNGTVHLEKIMDNPFEGRPKPRFKVWQQCVKFICDVVHFSGTEKPWMRGPPVDFHTSPNKSQPMYHWFMVLSQINDEFDVGLNLYDWKLKGQVPPLGLFARQADMKRRAIASQRNDSRAG